MTIKELLEPSSNYPLIQIFFNRQKRFEDMCYPKSWERYKVAQYSLDIKFGYMTRTVIPVLRIIADNYY